MDIFFSLLNCKKFRSKSINMHNPYVSLLFALSRIFPCVANEEACDCRLNSRGGSAPRTASRWENKTGSLFHLRATFNISMDVKTWVCRSPRWAFCNGAILGEAAASSYERITSCNLTRSTLSPTLIPPSTPAT